MKDCSDASGEVLGLIIKIEIFSNYLHKVNKSDYQQILSCFKMLATLLHEVMKVEKLQNIITAIKDIFSERSKTISKIITDHKK